MPRLGRCQGAKVAPGAFGWPPGGHRRRQIFLEKTHVNMAVCQNLVPLVNINIAGKWMFIPLKMVLIGIDPYPYDHIYAG